MNKKEKNYFSNVEKDTSKKLNIISFDKKKKKEEKKINERVIPVIKKKDFTSTKKEE
jgi:hypothetical protein